MNQLKAGAVLNYVAIILNMVIGLLYTPYMLRMLGQAEYGLYSLAASIIAYLTVLDLGFGNAIIRYTAKFRAEGKIDEQKYMFGMFLVLYIGIGIIAVIAGAVLSLNVESIFSAKMTENEGDRTRIMLWLMTFNLAFTFPMSIWGSIMTAYERFTFPRIVSIVRSVLNPLVMVALLAIGYKALAMVIVTTIFNVVTLLINYWYCKNKLKIEFRYGKFDFKFLKEVSVYSFWIFLNVIMDRIYWSTGQFVLGIYRGTVAIAIYAIAIQLQQMYMMFSTAISSVFLPKVTTMVARGDNEKEISDLFIRTGRIQYIVMAFILTGYIIFGKNFILLWAGANYENAYIISLLFFVPLTVPLIQNMGIIILQARNQMKFRSLLYIAIAIICFVISFPLGKNYGGIGCAIATASALTIGQIIVMNIYYYKSQHLDTIKFWKEIIKMTVIPSIFISTYFIFRNEANSFFSSTSNLIYGILLFSILYIPLFWKTSMKQSEKELFAKPLKKVIKRN